MDLALELAERPLDRQPATLLGHLHGGRERDRQSTDT
jgi:hypothetical protein